jgi:hypothetical protein
LDHEDCLLVGTAAGLKVIVTAGDAGIGAAMAKYLCNDESAYEDGSDPVAA